MSAPYRGGMGAPVAVDPPRHGPGYATSSRTEVTHPIWLLKTVHWWYLLPLGAPMLVFFGWCALSAPEPVMFSFLALLVLVGVVVLLGVSIYWLNQVAVK